MAHSWEEEQEQETEEEEEVEISERDAEYNLRAFGIHQALPVPEGPRDWDAGAVA